MRGYGNFNLATIGATFSVIQRAFPRITCIGYQTKAFVLLSFRNVISKSHQIDSLKNAQDDPKFLHIYDIC